MSKAIVRLNIPTDYADEYKQWIIEGRLYYLEDGAWTFLKEVECELEPYREAIPIEWLHSIMKRQLIFAMSSEMEGTTTVKDGVIHCISGAVACQVVANVIKLWEKENEESN